MGNVTLSQPGVVRPKYYKRHIQIILHAWTWEDQFEPGFLELNQRYSDHDFTQYQQRCKFWKDGTMMSGKLLLQVITGGNLTRYKTQQHPDFWLRYEYNMDGVLDYYRIENPHHRWIIKLEVGRLLFKQVVARVEYHLPKDPRLRVFASARILEGILGHCVSDYRFLKRNAEQLCQVDQGHYSDDPLRHQSMFDLHNYHFLINFVTEFQDDEQVLTGIAKWLLLTSELIYTHSSPRLKKSPTFLCDMLGRNNNPNLLQHFDFTSLDYASGRCMFRKCVQINGLCLEYGKCNGWNFQDDEDIVDCALRNDGSAIRFVSKRIRNQHGMIMLAGRTFGIENALNYAGFRAKLEHHVQNTLHIPRRHKEVLSTERYVVILVNNELQRLNMPTLNVRRDSPIQTSTVHHLFERCNRSPVLIYYWLTNYVDDWFVVPREIDGQSVCGEVGGGSSDETKDDQSYKKNDCDAYTKNYDMSPLMTNICHSLGIDSRAEIDPVGKALEIIEDRNNAFAAIGL